MFPLWDIAIEPVLAAAQAKRIVEIGALRGETTARMLEGLGADAELHVVDPVPVFDPSEHERRFPGRYFFHRDLSLRVLGTLPPMDAALIDGDHNWYTVYHELGALRDVARAASRPLPVLILHDVCWPYGRRDLYYAPDQIPQEHRQPYAQLGIVPGIAELVSTGGLNPTNYNAVREGGPRNGVMTALEDFLAELGEPVRVVVLPVYFGLAIAVQQRLLAQHPGLERVLDHLEGPDGQRALAELSERVRLDAMVMQHGVFYSAEANIGRAVGLYLDLLKGALLDEHYLEQELRIHQLARSVETGQPPFGESLRDPTRRLIAQTAALRAQRRSGLPVSPGAEPGYFALTEMGRVRLDRLQAALETVRRESVAGDLVECGTGRGGGAVFFRGFCEAYNMPFPRVIVADPFRAAPPGHSTTTPVGPGELPGGGVGFPELHADLNSVRDAFERFGLLDDRVRFVQGPYEQALADAPIQKIALLRLGETVKGDAGTVLDALYDRVSIGGVIVVDQHADPACAAGVAEFRSQRGIDEPLHNHDWTAVEWRKMTEHPAASAPVTKAEHMPVPLQKPLWIGKLDLTVAVVFFNMRREAARTLHSLSRAYQEGVENLDYEVLVVDNGSDPDERLTADFVERFGPEFRLIDMVERATPSPAIALNRALETARGDAVALMVDGAHVLTPGVLRFGMAGIQTYAPAVVATQQWFVGPGEQSDAVADGYDQRTEDELFDKIAWPANGYKLFDIGHFIGERDWLDGMWESNCLFVPRALLAQVGGFDERFSEPGGGYANLDLYERMSLSPEVTLVTILGEGSFHQVHGGTTTNLADPQARHERLNTYARHFEQLRGRGFLGHNKQMHYVGTMRAEAARTRARRRVVPNPFSTPSQDGAPKERQPMPRDLRAAFLESYWSSLAWQTTTWLGAEIDKPPGDLVAYQELISRVRPDWIIETGTGNGARARFLASICDLIDQGAVVSIGADVLDGRPEHPRITYVHGVPDRAETADRVRDIVGSSQTALVILGSRTTSGRTSAEFRLYGPFVGKGSYVVVEDTIVNGHPVWTGYGPGPYEAVKGMVETRGDFAIDRTMDRYFPSFCPGGFLKRG